MTSTAKTADDYLANLPEDRRAALSVVRDVILKNLDKDYEEGMQYGMIGYYVPHRVYPAGYHCDPKQPLPFIALGSQKNYMTIHMMCLYMNDVQQEVFRKAWAKTGKKLDMGKACIRFKKIDDIALEVIGEAIKRVPAKLYISTIEKAMEKRGRTAKKGARTARRKKAK
jgi:hypothetical protein